MIKHITGNLNNIFLYIYVNPLFASNDVSKEKIVGCFVDNLPLYLTYQQQGFVWEGQGYLVVTGYQV